MENARVRGAGREGRGYNHNTTAADERTHMATTPAYLEYVLDLLADVPDVSTRKMMGEYLLYASGKLFGGIYDDRFLVKDSPAAAAMLPTLETPYEGAAPMRLVDIESRDAITQLVGDMLDELPAAKKRRK